MGKIVFFSIPASGHTNPTIEVVRELAGRGHEILYYSFRAFEDAVTQAGARFIPCDDYLMELKKDDEGRIGTDFSFLIEMLEDTTLSMDEAVCRELSEFRPDCVVFDSMCLWGRLFAAKLKLPCVCSTTTFAFNRYSAKIMSRSLRETVSMLAATPRIGRCLKKLRAHGYPVKNLLSIIENDSATRTIVYTSFHFQPCAETFPADRFFFVGPSVAPAPAPSRTDALLGRSRRRIYISLGTVNNRNTAFYKNCIKAFSDSAIELLLSVGEQTDIASLGPVPTNITVKNRVRQTEALQDVDVFLTHCGMNSVNEGLYYGVPLILFPQQSEQAGVARRVEQLGAGCYLKKNTPKAILDTALHVLGNPSYRQRALELSEDFHRCGGPGMAADVIEDAVSQAKKK